MKKIIYIITLFVVASLSITACTKEEVRPATGDTIGGRAIKE